MKYTFNQFKKLLFESILDEDKSRLIDKLILPDIEDEEEKLKVKDEMKTFFKRYSNFENKLDWNKLDSITYADFEKIRDQATQTKGAQKREIASGNIKSIFKSVNGRKFEIVGETKDWLFIAPLNYEAAVYCDSSENQGAGAKWCIGTKDNDSYWNRYTMNKKSLFIMAFNKNYKSMSQEELQSNLKYMIERKEDGSLNIWDQDDSVHYNTYDFGGQDYLNDLFKIVEVKFNETKQNEIKEKLENLNKITKIDKDYFSDYEKIYIVELEIPDNITTIDDNAFYGCSQLTKLKIGNGVTNIGKEAFEYCTNLKEVILGNNITEIPYGMFAHCKKLTSITIPEKVILIGEFAFYETALKEIIIPNSVKTIERDAFWRCKKLENVSFGTGLTNIYHSAFSECESLTSIKIPDTVSNFDNGVFSDCINLSNIILSKNITNIGWNTFYKCKALKNIEIPDKVTNIDQSAFAFSGITNLKIPNSVKTIKDNAFYFCENLIHISIPSNITSIDKNAFQFCTKLKSISFKDKTMDEVESMDNYPWGIEDPDEIIKVES